MKLHRSGNVDRGYHGVRYRSDVEQGSDEERLLREVQLELSATDSPDASQARLFLVSVAVVGGDQKDLVGLWVPEDQKDTAETMLCERGFELDDVL